jgi:hypothetical protein
MATDDVGAIEFLRTGSSSKAAPSKGGPSGIKAHEPIGIESSSTSTRKG